tara:strand:- start:3867 stop:4532 length:666 start_codon:yes stop_codon:yes gene_type:complete
MEDLNDTKINRMVNSAFEVHYGQEKGIDMTHLLPTTIHELQDGSGLQMILTPKNKASSDGVIKMTELLRDLGNQGIKSHGITQNMLRTLNKSASKMYGGTIDKYIGKGSKKLKKTHRGGNIQLITMSGGDIGRSLKSALIPSLIAISPLLVKSIGSLVKNKDKDKFKKDMKDIGTMGIKGIVLNTAKNELIDLYKGLDKPYEKDETTLIEEMAKFNLFRKK